MRYRRYACDDCYRRNSPSSGYRRPRKSASRVRLLDARDVQTGAQQSRLRGSPAEASGKTRGRKRSANRFAQNKHPVRSFHAENNHVERALLPVESLPASRNAPSYITYESLWRVLTAQLAGIIHFYRPLPGDCGLCFIWAPVRAEYARIRRWSSYDSATTMD